MSEDIATGQSWRYRAPEGFEESRLVVGAIVRFERGENIVCCSVSKLPRKLNGAAHETITLPFLPLTESAFRASVSEQDGVGDLPESFPKRLLMWAEDEKGMVAFKVPFAGNLEQMVELQFGRRTDAAREASEARIVEIGNILASGLETEIEPFPGTQAEFETILKRLRELPAGDIKGKLVIGGFLNHPHGADQMRCLECIYYLPHRLWCDLPELDIPVEPYWWCRLWRV
ncbi:MAG: hypothetical protein AB7S70_11025 [Hyphomicrobium sp.]|uniref:hypothetical protein n=1 Tax=Hyphomicrobium sp. TaxID=82 RepID=UPI003D1336AF